MLVCEECCQSYSESMKCYCNGGLPSTKHIGLVSGCVVFENNIRCKGRITDNVVCQEHNIINKKNDYGYLEKLFN